MFDDNTAIKLVLGLLVPIVWALQIVIAAKRRRSQQDWSLPVDTWSTEKFGIWWIGRGLAVLVTLVAAIGFALGGKGSSSGTLVLFSFTAAGILLGFLRSRV